MENTLPSLDRRNYGIDLLRMLSMFMVSVLHVLGQGSVLSASAKIPLNYSFAWFLEISAYCAVNCYALISGYVGVKSRFKYSNILYLWLQVLFYTLSITLVYSFYKPDLVDSKAIANAFLPVIRKDYWYFTAYFLMFFFTPLFNSALKNLPRRQLRAVLIVSVFLFTFIPCFARLKLWEGGISDLFWTSGGYNTCWLSVLYLVGGYVRLYSPFEKVKNWVFALLFLLSSLFTLGVKLTVEHRLPFWKNAGLHSTLVNYTSPTIFLCGFCLLLIFCRLRITWGKKPIAFLSPLAFGVYLNHVNPLIWNDVIKGRWRSYAALPALQMVGMVLLTALAIYGICSLIDYVRLLIFKGLRIREGLVFLEKKLFSALWEEEK